MMLPHMANDVSCVTPINDENDFSWQAQYLVDDFCCSAHCNLQMTFHMEPPSIMAVTL